MTDALAFKKLSRIFIVGGEEGRKTFMNRKIYNRGNATEARKAQESRRRISVGVSTEYPVIWDNG